jgi:hypothetical protein
LKNLKKIISENEDEDKNDDIKEESKESSQSEKTAPFADTDGEKNEN